MFAVNARVSWDYDLFNGRSPFYDGHSPFPHGHSPITIRAFALFPRAFALPHGLTPVAGCVALSGLGGAVRIKWAIMMVKMTDIEP